MSRPSGGAPAPHLPRGSATSVRAELWAPSESRQLLVSLAVLLGPGLLGALIMGITSLSAGGLRGLFEGLVEGGFVGLLCGGIPLAMAAVLVYLVAGSRFPKRWLHDLTHVLEIDGGRVLLRDAHGALLGDTGARSLSVQKDNVLRYVGKHRVLAGALRLSTRDRQGVRVVGRTVIAAWPGLPAETTDFREVDDHVFRTLERV